MQKKLVQSSLALSAAAALGLGSAFFAGPAIAADKPVIDVQSESAVQDAVAEYLANDKGELPAEIGRFGSVTFSLIRGPVMLMMVQYAIVSGTPSTATSKR